MSKRNRPLTAKQRRALSDLMRQVSAVRSAATGKAPKGDDENEF